MVSTTQVESLPLVNRNFTQIMTLSAGVVAGVTQADELGRGSGGGEIPENEGKGENVNGARASDINFRMDGGPTLPTTTMPTLSACRFPI